MGFLCLASSHSKIFIGCIKGSKNLLWKLAVIWVVFTMPWQTEYSRKLFSAEKTENWNGQGIHYVFSLYGRKAKIKWRPVDFRKLRHTINLKGCSRTTDGRNSMLERRDDQFIDSVLLSVTRNIYKVTGYEPEPDEEKANNIFYDLTCDLFYDMMLRRVDDE